MTATRKMGRENTIFDELNSEGVTHLNFYQHFSFSTECKANKTSTMTKHVQ